MRKKVVKHKIAKPKKKPRIKVKDYFVFATRAGSINPDADLPEWCPSGWVTILWDEGGYCGFRPWSMTMAPNPSGCAIYLDKHPDKISLLDAIALEWETQFGGESVRWEYKLIIVDAIGAWAHFTYSPTQEE